ncbi:MAG: DUF1800 domain-containing protein [Tahibacter sp.]
MLVSPSPAFVASRRRLFDALAAASGFVPEQPVPMRRPGKSSVKSVAAPTPNAIPTPAAAVRWLQKATFGYTRADYDALNALAGGDDNARWQTWVTQQTAPAGIADAACDARITAAAFTTLGKTVQQLWTDHHSQTTNYYLRMLPIAEVECLAGIRAVYSKRQLQEVMAEFWHDHFSTFAWDYDGGPTFVQYDRDVIRPNIFGNFRTMLEAVGKSVMMLYFLDNASNTNSGPNENYARELFELHTLGAENYYGVIYQNAVPNDASNAALPAGYCDDDVYESARCFTGWTLKDGHYPYTTAADNTGEYIYRSGEHDAGIKNVLRVHMVYNQPPEKDGKDVMNALAAHPGTARFIARKLCRRLIMDDPSQALVDSIAQLFQSTWQAPDQLAQVTRTILLSNEFKSTWGAKMKRPLNAYYSALRGLGVDYTPKPDNSAVYTPNEELTYRLQLAGQRAFYWPAPNGYPDRISAWASSGSLGMTWRMLSRLTEVHQNDAYNGAQPLIADVLGITTANVATKTASNIIGYWFDRLLGPGFRPEPSFSKIVAFLQQNALPAEVLTLDDNWHGGATPDLKNHYNQQRLRAAVGLILLSPEFLRR